MLSTDRCEIVNSRSLLVCCCTLVVSACGERAAVRPAAHGANRSATPVTSRCARRASHSRRSSDQRRRPSGGPATGWAEGGPIAIHGTDEPWSMGRAVSNGCIRVENATLRRIFAAAIVGTPVVVRR
jgi:lipoprotein-anchoring transpeptidase ErfK/SrfK